MMTSAAMTRSQGNPLFSLQLVHAWASGGHLVLEQGVYSVADAVKNGRAVVPFVLRSGRCARAPPMSTARTP